MTGVPTPTFTVCVDIEGMGRLVTVPGHMRRRWLPRVDIEHALIVIGAIGVLATVAVLLWGQV
jgi:hypothetical protein